MITIAWVLIGIGGLVSLVGGIMLLIAAYRVSVGWFLALFFLSWLVVPPIIFLVKHWHEARTGFLISVGGWVLTGIGWFVLAGSVATLAMAEFENFDVQQPEPMDLPLDNAAVDPFDWNDEDPTAIADPEPFEAPLPTPTETPIPAEEYEELQAALAESAAREKYIAFSSAHQHVGELVKVHLSDGTTVVVTINAVNLQGMHVTRRVGGGSVSFSIRRQGIEEIQLLR